MPEPRQQGEDVQDYRERVHIQGDFLTPEEIVQLAATIPPEEPCFLLVRSWEDIYIDGYGTLGTWERIVACLARLRAAREAGAVRTPCLP